MRFVLDVRMEVFEKAIQKIVKARIRRRERLEHVKILLDLTDQPGKRAPDQREENGLIQLDVALDPCPSTQSLRRQDASPSRDT